MSHENRTALVTGANRGIGLAISKALAVDHGMKVLAAVRNATVVAETASAIGNRAEGVIMDLADPLRVERDVRDLDKRIGPIDVLVNNAGVLFSGAGTQVPVEDVQESLGVNALAPFALIRALAPECNREDGDGS